MSFIKGFITGAGKQYLDERNRRSKLYDEAKVAAEERLKDVSFKKDLIKETYDLKAKAKSQELKDEMALINAAFGGAPTEAPTSASPEGSGGSDTLKDDPNVKIEQYAGEAQDVVSGGSNSDRMTIYDKLNTNDPVQRDAILKAAAISPMMNKMVTTAASMRSAEYTANRDRRAEDRYQQAGDDRRKKVEEDLATTTPTEGDPIPQAIEKKVSSLRNKEGYAPSPLHPRESGEIFEDPAYNSSVNRILAAGKYVANANRLPGGSAKVNINGNQVADNLWSLMQIGNSAQHFITKQASEGSDAMSSKQLPKLEQDYKQAIINLHHALGDNVQLTANTLDTLDAPYYDGKKLHAGLDKVESLKLVNFLVKGGKAPSQSKVKQTTGDNKPTEKSSDPRIGKTFEFKKGEGKYVVTGVDKDGQLTYKPLDAQ